MIIALKIFLTALSIAMMLCGAIFIKEASDWHMRWWDYLFGLVVLLIGAFLFYGAWWLI